MKKTLTTGLLSGYTSDNSIEIQRGVFKGRQSIVQAGTNSYHDEWFVPTHCGGGQELVKTHDGSYTRLYGGGTPKQSELDRLGITVSDVSKYLIKMIVQLGDATRLHSDCKPAKDGKWQYSYTITAKHSTTNVITGTEIIKYDGVEVHVHAFVLCPVV